MIILRAIEYYMSTIYPYMWTWMYAFLVCVCMCVMSVRVCYVCTLILDINVNEIVCKYCSPKHNFTASLRIVSHFFLPEQTIKYVVSWFRVSNFTNVCVWTQLKITCISRTLACACWKVLVMRSYTSCMTKYLYFYGNSLKPLGNIGILIAFRYLFDGSL